MKIDDWLLYVLIILCYQHVSAFLLAIQKSYCHRFMNCHATNPILTEPATISTEKILRFERLGHVKFENFIENLYLKQFLIPSVDKLLKKHLLSAYQHHVEVILGIDAKAMTLQQCQDQLQHVNKDQIPFQQIFHLWKQSTEIKRLACSTTLGEIAALLLGVNAVRLYQDSVFVKPPGYGDTRWHSDLHMAPFDSNNMITCWIPLTEIPSIKQGGTGLQYASKSHKDFSLLFC